MEITHCLTLERPTEASPSDVLLLVNFPRQPKRIHAQAKLCKQMEKFRAVPFNSYIIIIDEYKNKANRQNDHRLALLFPLRAKNSSAQAELPRQTLFRKAPDVSNLAVGPLAQFGSDCYHGFGSW